MEQKRCVVICAGEQGNIDFEFKKSDFIICCDAGYKAAKLLGVKPDILIGDFDSYDEPLPKDIETIRFPVEKDDTDGMLALREGLRRGFKSFALLFSLGGRLDHTMANIQALAFLEQNGASGELIGPFDRVKLIRNSSLDIPQREGYNFSIFAFGGAAHGVTLTGMQYLLDNATVTETFPIGMGNHITSSVGRVSVSNGRLLVMESKIDR